MQEAWVNFSVLILVQLVLFLILIHFQKKWSAMGKVLTQGVLVGVVFGVCFDLVAGEFLGLHSYELGFGILFLFLNAVLSYGLFSATTLLFQGTRVLPLFGWSCLIMAMYEITNQFFRVWTWEFSLSAIPFLFVLAAGYFGGTLLVISVRRIVLT